VVDAVDLPTVREATVQLAAGVTLVVHDPDQPLQPGDPCDVTLPPDAVLAWPGSGPPLDELDRAPVPSGARF
jgi:hypothetical protein